jgi:deoxyadenosine/deoxycytidine kinase
MSAAAATTAKPIAAGYSDQRIVYCTVEGSIGAGKSTFFDRVVPLFKRDLGKNCMLFVVEEPLQTWMDLGMFSAFNKDKPGHAMQFQAVAFSTRIGVFAKAYEAARLYVNGDPDRRTAVLLSERSWCGDRIFAEVNHALGAITDEQYKVYDVLFDSWDAGVSRRRADIVLWIKTTTDECQGRVRTRARPGEVIEDSYQQALVNEHERQLGQGVFSGSPVYVFDGMQDFKTSDKVCADMAERLALLVAAAFARTLSQWPTVV